MVPRIQHNKCNTNKRKSRLLNVVSVGNATDTTRYIPHDGFLSSRKYLLFNPTKIFEKYCLVDFDNQKNLKFRMEDLPKIGSDNSENHYRRHFI